MELFFEELIELNYYNQSSGIDGVQFDDTIYYYYYYYTPV